MKRRWEKKERKCFMKNKVLGRRCIAISLAAALSAGLTACGNTGGDTQAATTETTQITETVQTAERIYSLTEENENQELTMARQPESSYWFPSELLSWDAKTDEDLRFNVSTVPLSERAAREHLQTVNSTQNKETNIMAISIMNSSTSGNPPHGLNKVNANTFTYWQYVDTLVYWGGSSGEGLIVSPSPDVVDAAHKNGVRVLGTVFMPQTAHGGKMEWLEDLLVKNEDGSYPVADKLIEVAQTYGFEGWFMNQETEGTDEEPLTADHAARMQQFIQYFKEQAPDLDLVYYDSMTVDGKMDWQNALTEENLAYLVSEDGDPVADAMFLNFWWTSDTLADQELLKKSAALASENGINPYDLYAGVDIQSEGYNTEIKWDLFENEEGGTYTSLGLYCPSWAYTSADTIQNFWKQENKLWVNSMGDPSADVKKLSNTQWKGISSYIVERTPLTSLPFVTNFSTGNGYSFFKNGSQISLLDWNNRSIADIMPTYRYIIENGNGNKLSADLDVADAYYGGTSLILRGNMAKDTSSTIKLYAAELTAADNMIYTTAAKAKGTEITLNAVLELEDGSVVTLEGDQNVGEEWTVVSYDTSSIIGKTIKSISYEITSAEDVSGLQLRFGNITMMEADSEENAAVSNLEVLDSEFDEDGMYAGVRLAWSSDIDADYYEVYRVNQDNSRSLLGVSNTTSFYINTLPRTDDTNKSAFEVVPVNAALEEGNSAQVVMDWPDNSLPKADFAADVTLAAPGTKITFESLCSANTETVNWTFAGADIETAEGESVSVSYPEEGIYSVKVTAVNKAGSIEKEKEGYIVITSDAADGLVLLSQGAGTEADAYVNENEAPEFAVDGDVSTKWCATGAAPHEITLDLGEVNTVSAVDIFHAEAGGESADMNTKSYTILVSQDGNSFEEVYSVTKNTNGTTHNAFTPKDARYVKLVVNKPTQGSDSAARIYEIEVYGIK